MNYAVIRTGGKQYKISKDSVLEVEKLNAKAGEKIEFQEVLLYVSDEKVKLGKPTVKGMVVQAQVLEHIKGEKLRISKFRAKTRYRRTIGFRPQFSKIKILDILTAVKN